MSLSLGSLKKKCKQQTKTFMLTQTKKLLQEFICFQNINNRIFIMYFTEVLVENFNRLMEDSQKPDITHKINVQVEIFVNN